MRMPIEIEGESQNMMHFIETNQYSDRENFFLNKFLSNTGQLIKPLGGKMRLTLNGQSLDFCNCHYSLVKRWTVTRG